VIRVWDRVVRSLHWLLVIAVVTAWISGHWPGRWFEEVHHGAGYLAGAVVLLRAAWGFVGTRHARFAQFVRGPAGTLEYARRLRRASEPRYVGHNPLGGWMVLALLATAAAASLTGVLYVTEWLWGYAWLETLHAALAWLLLLLVGGHLGGVFFTARRHRERLVRAMLDGRKRAPASDDIG
jgi:cytochrome b